MMRIACAAAATLMAALVIGCGGGSAGSAPPTATPTLPRTVPTRISTSVATASTPTATATVSPTLVSEPVPPQRPEITSPDPEGVDGIAATDVHLEATAFFDANGDSPLSSEWEIWDLASDVRVWRATASGVELSHVHLSNGRLEGPIANLRNLDFDRTYRARVRYTDNSGDPLSATSDWSEWRTFHTAPFGIPPLTAAAIAADPSLVWMDESGAELAVPAGLIVEWQRAPRSSEEDFVTIYSWTDDIRAPDPSVDEAPLRLWMSNQSGQHVDLPASRMVFTIVTSDGPREVMAYLPAVSLDAGDREAFWVGRSGATFAADPGAEQREPSFDRPQRETAIPWATAPGYVVDEVASGFRFPTQVIAIPGARGESELLVMELHGKIWSVDAVGNKRLFADDLIETRPPNPNISPGQVGLGGMTYDAASGSLYVTRTYRTMAPPIEWNSRREPPALELFLPSTAEWSTGGRKTQVVRYLEVGGETSWTFSARIQFGAEGHDSRWRAGTSFGLVAYRDEKNAIFFTFQNDRHVIEKLAEDVRTIEADITAPTAAGWLRIDYANGAMTFYYRGDDEAEWQSVHSIDNLPFTPTHVGLNGRNAFNLIARATFSGISYNGAAINPGRLRDDTDEVPATWLHNQVIRVRDSDGDGFAERVDNVLDMPDDISHESHQIQDIELAPDGTLLVSVGDGFDFNAGRRLTTFLGKILRLETNGSAPTDNPFYDADQPRAPVSYVYAYGLRNTYGMAMRRSDGRLFCSENGPSRDRVYSPNRGDDMGYDGTDRSILTKALVTWAPTVVPTGIDVLQDGAFPAEPLGSIYVGTAGQDYTLGRSKTGKRILSMTVDDDGRLLSGPHELLHYEGSARATVIGLAFANDGLYFTTLYNTDPTRDPFSNARLLRVRWTGTN